MKYRFHWDDWNREHVIKHGVSRLEAEAVVASARSHYPRESKDGKFVVWGRTPDGRYIQVVFVWHTDDQIDLTSMTLEDMIELDERQALARYIIHARDLTRREKAQYRQFK